MIRMVPLLLWTMMGSWALAAPCTNMQLQATQTAFDLTMNPNVQGGLVVKANTQPGGCDYFVTFDYGSSASYTSRSLKNTQTLSTWPFQIYKDVGYTSILLNIPQATSNNQVLTGAFPDNPGNSDAHQGLSYYVTVDQSSPWQRYGNYAEWITASLYRGTLTNYQFVQSVILNFQYNAPKRVDISVVPTGGAFNINDINETMDFGELTTGQTKSCDVILKYNAGYMLFVSSQNGGRLWNQATNSYIPYTFSMAGATVHLTSNSSQIARELGMSPSSGKILPVSVTIGNVTGGTGTYNDVITLTVQSAE